MKMPFGKYKGEELEDIPTDYIRWCLENMNLTASLAEEMENQIRMKENREGVPRRKDEI